MASSLCKIAVMRVYQDVIEDVISGVRELFLEDGVDEHILQELKQTWEAKLMASKAVESHQNEEKPSVKKSGDATNGTNGFPKPQQQTPMMKQVVGQVPPNNHMQTPIPQVLENKMVPIQITLPVHAGSEAGRVLTIQVPAAALQNNQLQKVLTGPVITATMNLPQPIASTILQQHVNAAFNSQQQAMNIGSIVNKSVIQTDGAANSDSDDDVFLQPCSSTKRVRKRIRARITPQVDGPADTSDEDEEGSDEEDASEDVDEDKEEEDQDVEEGGPEEEPLNSEDDVTDEDPTDLFDTENVVVCQYDKITRSRNKWRFHLKDGIMNLNGEDYVFQKANGDAEW